MCKCERPIGAAKGKPTNTIALCHPPPPPPAASPFPKMAPKFWSAVQPVAPGPHGESWGP